MNCIRLSNYDKANEPIIIMELTNILSPLNRYYFRRISEKTTEIEIVIDSRVDFSQLLTMKQSMQLLLDVFQKNSVPMRSANILNQGKVKLLKHHFFAEETLMSEYLFNINSSFQDLLVEIYFYIELNDIKKEEIFPVLIYHLAKVSVKDDFISKELFYKLLVKEYHPGTRKNINVWEVLQRFELEHAALLDMLCVEWHKLCIKINHQVDYYMKQHGYYIMSTLGRPTEMDQADYDLIINEEYEVNLAERTQLIHEIVASIFTRTFTFLNISQVEKQYYVQLASLIAKKHEEPGINRYKKRRM